MKGGTVASATVPFFRPLAADCAPLAGDTRLPIWSSGGSTAPVKGFPRSEGQAGAEMARYELLNNVAHSHLRVSARFNAEYGDDVGMVEAFPTEFAEMQREYPIFFRKDSDGSFHAVALLGFAPNENLYLRDDRWQANYLPAVIARGPFLIGFQEQMVDGQLRNEPVLHVDLDHPRVRDGHGNGHPLFAPQGGHSPYLEKAIRVLRGLHAGAGAAKTMYA